MAKEFIGIPYQMADAGANRRDAGIQRPNSCFMMLSIGDS
jgi:hypothetical protein